MSDACAWVDMLDQHTARNGAVSSRSNSDVELSIEVQMLLTIYTVICSACCDVRWQRQTQKGCIVNMYFGLDHHEHLSNQGHPSHFPRKAGHANMRR